MAAPKENVLVVEGPNDLHAILHLLRKAGVLAENLDGDSSPLEIVAVGDKKKVIKNIGPRSKESNRVRVGFVLDADHYSGDPPGLQPTWQSVCDQLQRIGATPPSTPAPHGYIDNLDETSRRIGIWIMPDNSSNGAIEEFLISLVDPQQLLMRFSKSTTKEARESHGATFRESQTSKAELSCWLAWQDEPAAKYGESVQAGRFDLGQPAAVHFCEWVKQLFDL